MKLKTRIQDKYFQILVKKPKNCTYIQKKQLPIVLNFFFNKQNLFK